MLGLRKARLIRDDARAALQRFKVTLSLGLGPDLTRGAFRHGSSDRALFRNVLTGIPGTDMTGIYRPDYQVWQVVSYVRSLSAKPAVIEVAGDVRRGAILYRSRGSCSGCHRLGGRGGRLGPDLSDVGWIRSPGHLEASLRTPGEVVDTDFRTVRVVHKDGSEVAGILRNEDTYSIQLLDEDENLRRADRRERADDQRREPGGLGQ